MRHQGGYKKLGRTTSHRKAMLSNMIAALVLRDRIETTLPKAKALRPLADRVVTLSKRNTVAARRRALMLTGDKKAVKRAFETLPSRFEKRNGGYTRIYRLGFRHGDSAPMAVIEYLHETRPETPKKETQKKQKSKKKEK